FCISTPENNKIKRAKIVTTLLLFIVFPRCQIHLEHTLPGHPTPCDFVLFCNLGKVFANKQLQPIFYRFCHLSVFSACIEVVVPAFKTCRNLFSYVTAIADILEKSFCQKQVLPPVFSEK